MHLRIIGNHYSLIDHWEQVVIQSFSADHNIHLFQKCVQPPLALLCSQKFYAILKLRWTRMFSNHITYLVLSVDVVDSDSSSADNIEDWLVLYAEIIL